MQGTLHHETCSIIEVEGRPNLKPFTTPLKLHLGKILIIHKLLVMPECPSPLLGKGVSLSHGDNFYSPWKPKPRNVSGWTMYYYIRHGQFSPKYPPEIEKYIYIYTYRSPDLELGNPRESKVCHSNKNYLKEGNGPLRTTSLPGISALPVQQNLCFSAPFLLM